MKATVRKIRCKDECHHCAGKWIVTYDNHSRRAVTWGLAMGYANKLARGAR